MRVSGDRLIVSFTGLLSCAVAILMLAGCGPSEPFSHVQVSGKVTYEDGTPIPAHHLRVIFVPQTPPVDKKTHPKFGTADIYKDKNPDGSFTWVTSHLPGDGLVVGKHKVQLDPKDENDNPLPKLVPPEVLDPKTTPLEIDTAVQPFVIKVKKPAGVK
jgi:hypothetical protein